MDCHAAAANYRPYNCHKITPIYFYDGSGLSYYKGGAKSQNGTSGNTINGISPSNPRKNEYINAAEEAFGKP